MPFAGKDTIHHPEPMKTGLTFLLAALLGIALVPGLPAQDDSTAELSAVAERYVAAYNAKKLDDILALFSPSAEMIDEIDGLSASGPDEIRAIFESSFSKFPDRQIALDVASVREIAKNVVIEEGSRVFREKSERGGRRGRLRRRHREGSGERDGSSPRAVSGSRPMSRIR